MNDIRLYSSPYLRTKGSLNRDIIDVIIALIPAVIMGVYNFGFYSMIVILMSVLICVACDLLCGFVRTKKISIDPSAVVTGLILALNVSPKIPLWIVCMGGAFAIIILKHLFGGLGKNIINPAMGARCLLLLLFFGTINRYVTPYGTSPKTIAFILEGTPPEFADILAGRLQGCIGTTSLAAMLLGFGYLLIRHVVDLKISLTYIASFAVLVFFFGSNRFDAAYILYDLMIGGVLMAALFCANDYITTPTMPKARYIFGVSAGIIAFIMMKFVNVEYAGAFSIVIMNIVTPIMEKFIVPDSFGA